MVWNTLVEAVIRPPRARYSTNKELPPAEFYIGGVRCMRKDFDVPNKHGHQLKCSYYAPSISSGGVTGSASFHQPAQPCVVYLHGNSGCRADANELVALLLPHGITVCAFDFSGSGQSDGQYVTLGANECEDVESVVSHLRSRGMGTRIALWGRSMGAATAVFYARRDPSIACLVLDSPFSSLMDVMKEVSVKFLSTSNGRIALPQAVAKGAIKLIARSIKKRAGFEVADLEVAKAAEEVFTPALLCHAEQDDFVPLHHSERVYNALAGDKNILKFAGDHNSERPQCFYDSAGIFLSRVMDIGQSTGDDTSAKQAQAHSKDVDKDVLHHQQEGQLQLQKEGSGLPAEAIAEALQAPGRTRSMSMQDKLDLVDADRNAGDEHGNVHSSLRRRPTEETWDWMLAAPNAEAGAEQTSTKEAAPKNEVPAEGVAALLAIGFDEQTARSALQRNNNDLQNAVEDLLAHHSDE